MKKIDFHESESNINILDNNMDNKITTFKKAFVENNIEIIPLNFKGIINKDGKFDKKVGFPTGWKKYTNKNYIDNGDMFCSRLNSGIAIKTGKINNISVVDIDTKDEEIIEKLLEYLELKSLNETTCIETNKGYHLYFHYNEELKTTTNLRPDLFGEGSIDIRNDGSIIFAPPTKYSCKEYEAEYKFYSDDLDLDGFIEELLGGGLLEELSDKFLECQKKTDSKSNKKITDFSSPTSPKKSPAVSPPSSDEEVLPEKKMTSKDFEKVKMALLKLDKKRATDYGLWLNVGIALFNNGDNMDNKTMRLWEEFSKQCNEKYDDMACMNKWMSFKPRENGLTIGSIFHWLKEDNPEEHKKMEKKKDKINWKDLYENNDGSFINEMNKICMYYEVDGTILYYNKQKTLLRNKESIARTHFKKDCFYIEDEGKKKKINPFDIWLEDDDRKDISEIIFKPIGKVEDYQLNLWNGFKYENTHSYQIERIQHILDHIKNVWASGDEELYEYFICWFARILQQPWNKNKVCIGLKSIEGVGKTCILELFAEIIGKEYYMECTDLERVVGKFNFMAQNKLLINFNETNWGGDKKMKGKFKSFITDGNVTIEPKGKDPYDIDCYSNCIITTNENWLVDVKGDDRRFNLIELKNEILDDDYYKKIYEFEYFQDLANYFYNYDISKYNPKKFKKSELHLEQVIQSQDSVELFITMIYEKDIAFSDDDDEEIILSKNHFFERYNEQSTGTYGTKLNNVHFFRRLRSILKESISIKSANKCNGSRVMISSLNNLRKEFDKYCGK